MLILIDSREKSPYDFLFYDCVEISRGKLDAGDYTTDILDGVVVIERKASPTEIAVNLGTKKNKERIYREFERLKDHEAVYFVCEFSESDVYGYPKNTGLSQAKIDKIRISGAYLMKLLRQIPQDYPNVHIVFCGSRDEAEMFTYSTLQEWESKYV